MNYYVTIINVLYWQQYYFLVYRVASLNMNDPTQQCPFAWKLSRNFLYYTGHQYCRMCERAIGYQIGSPDAIGLSARCRTIDSYYIYGVSITHGSPRNHIWTYAAGTTEGGGISGSNCPCFDPP